MSLVGALKGKGKTGFGYSSTAMEVTEGLALTGKTFLITGCNSGLGLETMRALTARGARVIGTARTVEKAAAAGREVGGEVVPLACELSDPTSVRACVAAVKAGGYKLDALIANAGIMALPKRELCHGYELQFFTNHIGHFLLVTNLLDSLAERGRVVIVSSAAHRNTPKGGIDFDNLAGEKGYSPWRFYGQSKLANLLFARELDRRLRGSGKTANALHPGVIRTNLGRHMGKAVDVIFSGVAPIFFKTIAEGAATQTFVAAHPGADGISGEYWSDCNVATSSAYGRDQALAEKLWAKSEEIAAALG